MMLRFYHMALLGFVAFSLSACSRPPAAPPAQAAAAAPPELLNHIVERYWDEAAALDPWYSWGGAETRFGEAPVDAIDPQSLADSLAIERRYLADVLSVPRAPLDPGSRLTYDIFRRDRELSIESFTYPAELVPVNPYAAVPQHFALMAAAAERYALSSDRDLENWRNRAEGYGRWTNQAIANMRDGMRRGYTLPRVLVAKTLPMLAALGEDSEGNVFNQALRSGAETADAARERQALAAVIKDTVLPSYRKLHDFLQQEYLPRARESVGLSALPLGSAWYAYLAKRATDGTSTPAELHALGVREVERLHGRVQALLAEASFAGNAQSFLDTLRADPGYSYGSAEALLSAYQELKGQVAAAMPALFAAEPHAEFQIRSVEGFRAATSPALSYRQSLAYGKTAAVLYVNTAQLEDRPATAAPSQFLREAVPGHHYQLALQQERADLPRFRRYGGTPAFMAGWGLYAASLGEELGIYRDAQEKFEFLIAQLDCAAGMVIDTGLHAQGWTRQRALDYLHAQLPLDDAAIENRVDRDLSLPGEALACTVGFQKIQEMRASAQQTLGDRFDLRAFHAEVLKDGAIPLDLLGAKLALWVEAASKSE